MSAKKKSFQNDLILIFGVSAILFSALVILWLVDGDQTFVSQWSSRIYQALVG